MKKINSVTKMLLLAMICGVMMVSCGKSGGRSANDAETKECTTETKKCESKSDEDKLIDELESMLESVLDAVKQLAAGSTDMNLITKMQAQTTGFTELQMQAEQAYEEGRLTDEQVARIERIGEKFEEAFQ